MRQHTKKEKSLSLRDVLCEECEKPLGTKRSLQRHINAKHQETHIGENRGDKEVTVSTNIELELDSVDVGDLVVMPLDPFIPKIP